MVLTHDSRSSVISFSCPYMIDDPSLEMKVVSTVSQGNPGALAKCVLPLRPHVWVGVNSPGKAGY